MKSKHDLIESDPSSVIGFTEILQWPIYGIERDLIWNVISYQGKTPKNLIPSQTLHTSTVGNVASITGSPTHVSNVVQCQQARTIKENLSQNTQHVKRDSIANVSHMRRPDLDNHYYAQKETNSGGDIVFLGTYIVYHCQLN